MDIKKVKIGVKSFYIYVVPLVALFFAAASYYGANAIAEKSGAFNKPILVGYLGQTRLKTGQASQLIVGVDFNKYSKGYVIGDVPVVVRNSGQKSLKNVDVLFRYHEVFNRGALESMKYIAAGGYAAKSVDKHFSKMGSFDFVSYRIPSLKPQDSGGINEPMVLEKTSISKDVAVDEGHHFRVTVDFAVLVGISISAEDVLPIDSQVQISTVDVASKEQFATKIDGFINSDLEQIREELGFFRYFLKLLAPKESKELSLAYPKISELSGSKYTFYAADITLDSIGFVRYPTIQWSYLFN